MTMTIHPQILIACVGNIFLSDDAFGPEVARRLAGRPRPDGVRLVDFGIRGFDLALALLDDATDVAILVDAVPRGDAPGTLYVIEPEWESGVECDPHEGALIETHSLDPVKVFRLVISLGGYRKPVLLVGCEPTPWREEDDPTMELSEAVAGSVDDAVLLVESLVTQFREGQHVGARAVSGDLHT
ncbi:hydrogenase maturation protease [Singulisphaera acidiphila]|uniref:Hydrogenase maturation protease n=1 Tax=Singulisphaera acidiphila (strain ATCC BAA-1392 / DSM 18658 / VKM B-2454 / MOB10) TaxID=886293 RepID=L0DIK2_SINAD|nr:hydrogenase maturation protease [Singulisphaera acidiphila]AGA28685.1 hydrogenase maturation protease [Singulisphaera acidiphila DSM 18658]